MAAMMEFRPFSFSQPAREPPARYSSIAPSFVGSERSVPTAPLARILHVRNKSLPSLPSPGLAPRHTRKNSVPAHPFPADLASAAAAATLRAERRKTHGRKSSAPVHAYRASRRSEDDGGDDATTVLLSEQQPAKAATAAGRGHGRKFSLAPAVVVSTMGASARKFSVAVAQTFKPRGRAARFPELAPRVLYLEDLQTQHFPPPLVPETLQGARGASGDSEAESRAFALLVAIVLLRQHGVQEADVLAFLQTHADAFPAGAGAAARAWSAEAFERWLGAARREGHWAVREADGDWGRAEGWRAGIRECFWGWWGEKEELVDEEEGSYSEL